MKFKRLIISVTLMLFLISLGTTAGADNISQIIGDGNTVIFIDVPINYWAKDQIDYFAQQGIIDGYDDGSFKPDAGVTREEFCKLLVSTFKAPLETPSSPTFADVAENRWSYPYIEVCKNFLTGYANPFGGLPTFHPEEYATREDIAVALVRIMGYTDSDVSDKNYALWKFKDGSNISPNLLAYVSLACEKGLISGYPDGSFGPTKGITRAETVVLLNRATKQAVTNINAELEMTASVLYSTDKKTATINIVTEEGTTVTVNGESVRMSSNYYGEYEGNYIYKFEQEGSKDFVVEATKGSKSKVTNLTAKYEIGTPILTITGFPATSDKANIRISGTVADTNTSARNINVTVNGSTVYVNSDGSWYSDISLKEGANTITIVAINSLGKSATEKVSIIFEIGSPELQFINCPEETKKPEISVKGKIKGNNTGAMLFVDDEEVYVNSSGEYSVTLKLKEGSNTFEFRAVNDYGKEVTVIKTITYTPDSE